MNPQPNLQRLRGQILADPSFLAQKLDFFSQRVLFVRLSAADYSQSSFLDDRILSPTTQGVWASFDDVSAALADAAPARPLHFIFHAGHVGSTLVSRLLENAGGVLSLREPLPLRSLAEARDVLESPESLVSPQRFADLLREQIVLWSRGYADTRAVVLKATSTAARLAPTLLAAAPAARAIYLHLPLEPYLATLLAGENSPIDLRGHAAERMRRLRRFGVEPLAPLHAMSLGELAAMAWCAEQLTAAGLKRACGERVLLADFERVLAAPEEAMRAFCGHFELDAPDAYFSRIRQDPSWSRYAKAPEHAYSPQDRAHILAAARADKAEEIGKGFAWFTSASARSPALAELAPFANPRPPA